MCVCSLLVSKQRGAPKPEPTQKVMRKQETTSVKVKKEINPTVKALAYTTCVRCPVTTQLLRLFNVINPDLCLSLQH